MSNRYLAFVSVICVLSWFPFTVYYLCVLDLRQYSLSVNGFWTKLSPCRCIQFCLVKYLHICICICVLWSSGDLKPKLNVTTQLKTNHHSHRILVNWIFRKWLLKQYPTCSRPFNNDSLNSTPKNTPSILDSPLSMSVEKHEHSGEPTRESFKWGVLMSRCDLLHAWFCQSFNP